MVSPGLFLCHCSYETPTHLSGLSRTLWKSIMDLSHTYAERAFLVRGSKGFATTLKTHRVFSIINPASQLIPCLERNMYWVKPAKF